MGRFTKETGGGDFQQAPAGSHVARCVKIIDIGTHHGEYLGEPTVRNQIIVQWELPEESIEIDGEKRPLIVSKFYTNSLSEKANLRRDLQSWRARPFTTEELLSFDLNTILNAPALLSIVHNDKNKAQIVGVSKLAKGMQCAPAYNKPSAFWIDEWNQRAFDELSSGFQRLITDSDEYKAMFEGGAAVKKQSAADIRDINAEAQLAAQEQDDDIPF
jgi:hypothetical protein